MIEINKFDSKEINNFTVLSKDYYGESDVSNYDCMKWKFSGFNKNYSFHLKKISDKNNEIIGRAVINQRHLNIFNQKTIPINQITDLLTVQKKSTVLTFIEIIKNFKIVSCDFVFHTSNENSEKIYRDLFKFKNPLSLDAYAIPIFPSELIEKYKKNIFIKSISKVYRAILFYLASTCLFIFNGFKFDVVKNISNIDLYDFESRSCNLKRDKEFIAWRYSSQARQYVIKKITYKNRLIGFIAYRKCKFKSATYLVVMDYLFSKKPTILEGFLIALHIVMVGVEVGADAIFTMLNPNNQDTANIVKLTYFKIPESFLPHGTPLFITPVDNKWLEVDFFAGLYYSLGDLDYF